MTTMYSFLRSQGIILRDLLRRFHTKKPFSGSTNLTTINNICHVKNSGVKRSKFK